MFIASEAKGKKRYLDQFVYILTVSAFEPISIRIMSWWNKPGLLKFIANWWTPSPAMNMAITIVDEQMLLVEASRLAKIEALTQNNQAKIIQSAFRSMQAQKEAKRIVDENLRKQAIARATVINTVVAGLPLFLSLQKTTRQTVVCSAVFAVTVLAYQRLIESNKAKPVHSEHHADEPLSSPTHTRESTGVGRQFLAAATLGGSELARHAPREGLISMFFNALSFGGLSLLQQLTDTLTPSTEKVTAKPSCPK